MPPHRNEASVADEVMQAFAQLPARAGLVVAGSLALLGVSVYLFAPAPGTLGDGIASAARYLLWGLAAVVLMGTASGVIRRWRDRQRFDSAGLDHLTWTEFEGYLAEYYRRRGCSVTPRGGSSSDGGVDLVVDDASGRRIVQAKYWKARRVGVVPLRALWGVLDDERAQGAVFVTTGSFTPDAIAFASGKRLELIDGPKLRRLVGALKSNAGADAPADAAATCPRCGRGRLVRKLARRGANAGSYFWGCDLFPECRYTRDIAVTTGSA
jgi:restriction system protein